MTRTRKTVAIILGTIVVLIVLFLLWWRPLTGIA